MSPRGSRRQKLDFSQKLVLNQWLISLFGVDPLADGYAQGEKPFHRLVKQLRLTREGLDSDGFHHFYHELKDGDFFPASKVSGEELQAYEENIVSLTSEINKRRSADRQIKWKYFQWLALIFVEIYLDRYFRDRNKLLQDLNNFVDLFNRKYDGFEPIAHYDDEDLNKICLQNATGSGKTLLMHINFYQFKYYAQKYNVWGNINFPFLLTPNARLSEQHRWELSTSGISGIPYSRDASGELGNYLYTLEIQKIKNEDGPETFAVRNFGVNNLLFVDEGHAGLSSSDDAAWMGYRAQLSEKGFTFEYSATFEQAVSGTGHEDEYAKAILFDYSYRWFYEDGYGKDYQIYNLPKTFDTVQFTYLTGSLLKYYQQLRIYEERKASFAGFNLEKPLWVFVGSTVTGGKRRLEAGDLVTATDVATIIEFVSKFLNDEHNSVETIKLLLTKTGAETGMLDANNNDFFYGAFDYLHQIMSGDEGKAKEFYNDILKRVFNGTSAGKLQLERLKGNAGEILLRAPFSEYNRPFGLINVGAPKELCDHLKTLPNIAEKVTFVEESEVTDPIFQSVRESSSPVNLLIGSKKFVEGWDCWRVSTLGLMHVGRTEGAQIIQLFGRGVRLKGWEWSLKRSNHSARAGNLPPHIHELELLNVFGIEADFMQKFKEYLKKEGLPGNEKRHTEKIPLNVTYDFGKKLKIIRPKRKREDGKEYSFKKDAPIPQIGEKPHYLVDNKVISDWYPRVQGVRSTSGPGVGEEKKHVKLDSAQLSMLDYTALYFNLERFKRERTWYNLNVTEEGIRKILSEDDWYDLLIPENLIHPTDFAGVRVLQNVAAELLRRYAEKLYDYSRRQFIEPRLEVRELTSEDENIPNVSNYIIDVDANDQTLIDHIKLLREELAKPENNGKIIPIGNIEGLNCFLHLFQPLFHLKKQGSITIIPVTLNDSEFKFVHHLVEYVKAHKEELKEECAEVYLLRNMSRGKGVGFAEASNFYPDFILWKVIGNKQYIAFAEPHGLKHEAIDSEKIKFAERIKVIQTRIGDPDIVLNSFIITPTAYRELPWASVTTQAELEAKHVLFMNINSDSGEDYLSKLFAMACT